MSDKSTCDTQHSVENVLPAMAFNNFGHVSIVCGNENVTLQRHKVVQCCHLRRVVWEEPQFRRLEQRLFPDLLHKEKQIVMREREPYV